MSAQAIYRSFFGHYLTKIVKKRQKCLFLAQSNYIYVLENQTIKLNFVLLTDQTQRLNPF